MSLQDDLSSLAAAGETSPDPKAPRTTIPKGWEPRVEVDVHGGLLVSTPRTPSVDEPDHAELLAEFDLDPQKWRVTALRRSRWQRYDGEWLEAYRASFVPHHASVSDLTLDVERLIDEVKKHKPAKGERPDGDHGLVAATGDTQLGKVDGDGTAGTVNRVLERFDASAYRVRALRKLGYGIGEVVLPWLGDCLEGNQSQGGNAAAAGRIDLTITEQVRVLRRIMMQQVKIMAPTASRIIVPVIPGNHDEAERRGSIVRSYTDSWAIEAGSAVADACAENPDAYGHVSFVFPKPDELTVTIDVQGTILGMAHGHQFGRDPLKWWAGQSHGRQPIGEAHILLGAHLHHLRLQDTGKDRVFMQVPALDGGSTWFRHRQGEDSRAGMLSFITANGSWSELSVL